MEKCAKWVKMNNPDIKGRLIFAYIGFVCACFLYVVMSSAWDMKLMAGGGIVVFVSALSLGKYSCERYSCVESAFANALKINISEVMRYHSFDVDEYYGIIKKQLRKSTVLIGICAIVMALVGGFTGEHVVFDGKRAAIFLVVGLISITAPYIAYYFEKKIFYYQMYNGNVGTVQFICSLISGAFFLVEIIFWIVSSILTLLILWGMFGQWVAPAVDETKIIFRNYNDEMGFLFLVAALLGELCLIANYKMKTIWQKVYNTAVGICVIVFIVGIVLTIRDSNIYTEFADDRFIVYNFGVEKDYGMEEIQSFRIYNNAVDDGIQFELTFNDGKSYKTLSSTSTNSNLYGENYYSEYNFISDYVKSLKNAGINGTLEDEEEIREYVNGLDEEVIIGFEEIVEIMK